MTPRSRRRAEAADAFDAALGSAVDGGPLGSDARLHLAVQMRRAQGMRETPRAQAKARMLRAFHAAAAPGSSDAGGSRDEPDSSVHAAHASLPGGGEIWVADVEQLTPERVGQIAEAVAAATKRREPRL